MFDMVKFCDDYGIPYSTHGKQISRGWLGLQDLFNKSSDTDWHLGWNTHGGYLYSWVDGGHSLWNWLEMVVPQERPSKIINTYDSDEDFATKWATSGRKNATNLEFNFPEIEKAGRSYLNRRGFDASYTIDKWGLRWGGTMRDFAYRIIAPILVDGVVVSYQGRSIVKDVEQRYKTLSLEKSLTDPKKVLYNLDSCKDDWVVVVEGTYDVWKFGDGCVATLGTSTTEAQCRLLTPYKRKIFLFDPEPQAQERARKMAEKVSALCGGTVEVVDMESGDKDLGAMSYAEVEDLKKLLGVC